MKNNDNKTGMAVENSTSLNNVQMSIEQLNEHLVKQSKALCDNTRNERIKYQKKGIPHTTGIIRFIVILIAR